MLYPFLFASEIAGKLYAGTPDRSAIFTGTEFLNRHSPGWIRTALLLLLLPCALSARDPREEKRIEHLLDRMGSLNDAVFIRNRSEYKAKDAVAHLRTKLRMAGTRVKTAEDFIEYCASRSSLSGEPYKIRLANGTVTETAPYFREWLREFDEPAKILP